MRVILVMVSILAGSVGAALPETLLGGKAIDCYCTDTYGGRVELGETTCLFVDGRAFLARCEMALNNPIWRETGEMCLMSDMKILIDDPASG